MVSCTGLVCGVGFFIGFIVLSEMVDTSTHESETQAVTASGGTVFIGTFKFNQSGIDGYNDKFIEGQCQLRGVSRAFGAADMALSSMDIRLKHDSVESDFALHSGLLLEVAPHVLEFYGKGETIPFMFSLSDSLVECELDKINLVFRQSGADSNLLVGQGAVGSTNCGFSIELTAEQINLTKLKRKIVNYSIMNNALSLALIKLFIDQMRILDSNSSFARLSVYTVIMQSIADSLESMLNFFVGISVQFLFNIFIIIALFKFILFSFFEMRLIILTYRSMHNSVLSTIDPYEASQMERNWIQSRMYLPLIGALVLLMVYPQWTMVPLLLVSQLFWVPQIVMDAQKGHKSTISAKFIVGVSVCRSILPMYVWGCPHSIFTLDVLPSPPSGGASVAGLVVFLQAVQVGLLLTQKKFGPRWFVPWICLPNVYNYYRKVDLDEEFGVPECVVCMADLDPKDRKNTVVTPCGHLFHPQCLQQWIDFGKMECPLCRRELPPIT